ncbi:hypothetical protein Tco_0189388 [Tanacetum coccineum]
MAHVIAMMVAAEAAVEAENAGIDLASSSCMTSTYPECLSASETFLSSSLDRKSTNRHSCAEAALSSLAMALAMDGMDKEGLVRIGIVFETKASSVGEDDGSGF